MTLFEKGARTLKLAAIVSIALIIFVGCSKDENKGGNPVDPGGNPTKQTVESILAEVGWIPTDIYPATKFGFDSVSNSGTINIYLTEDATKEEMKAWVIQILNKCKAVSTNGKINEVDLQNPPTYTGGEYDESFLDDFPSFGAGCQFTYLHPTHRILVTIGWMSDLYMISIKKWIKL